MITVALLSVTYSSRAGDVPTAIYWLKKGYVGHSYEQAWVAKLDLYQTQAHHYLITRKERITLIVHRNYKVKKGLATVRHPIPGLGVYL